MLSLQNRRVLRRSLHHLGRTPTETAVLSLVLEWGRDGRHFTGPGYRLLVQRLNSKVTQVTTLKAIKKLVDDGYLAVDEVPRGLTLVLTQKLIDDVTEADSKVDW